MLGNDAGGGGDLRMARFEGRLRGDFVGRAVAYLTDRGQNLGSMIVLAKTMCRDPSILSRRSEAVVRLLTGVKINGE